MINIFILLQGLIPGIGSAETAKTTEEVAKASGEVDKWKAMSLEDLVSRLADSAVSFAINLAVAIVVFYAGRFVIKKIYKLISSIFQSRAIDKSLSTFVLSLVNIVLYFILIVTVIGILGLRLLRFLPSLPLPVLQSVWRSAAHCRTLQVAC